MCALNLVNDYDQLTITSYCDWYGPNYTIAVQSSNFGQLVNVSPSTAMFLNGGSCVINRVAYNQTAANQLMANGFSTYTLQEQHHDLPANTNIESLTNAALSLAKNNTNQSPTIPIAIVAFAGVVIIAMSFVIYRRMKL
jgi:hypothetical protein